MSTGTIMTLQEDEVRQSLQSFWSGVLEVSTTKTGLALAMPLSLPDGWQILVELTQITPGYVRLSDGGRTLQWLAGRGQNIGSDGLQELLGHRMETFQIARDGWQLYRDVHLPMEGLDIHLFAEGLSSIAHLHYLYEPAQKTQDIARETVEKVFRERHLEFQRNAKLAGVVEKRITVDYFSELRLPVALQLVHRRGDVTPLMEQWGFRWNDLKRARKELQVAMVFDPAVTQIDATAQSIGESVCELFCPYSDAERVHDFLERAGGAVT